MHRTHLLTLLTSVAAAAATTRQLSRHLFRPDDMAPHLAHALMGMDVEFTVHAPVKHTS
jgi:hypothetical protein